MKVNIVFESSNGLLHDFRIMAELLMSMGHDVTMNASPRIECGLVIFLEHISCLHIDAAKDGTCIYIPNLEWMDVSDVNLLNHRALRSVCCKNRATLETLATFCDTCILTGFTSLEVPLIEKYTNKVECLHIKGTSMYKNSQLVVDTWLQNRNWPTLHVVCRGVIDIDPPLWAANNVVIHQRRFNEDELHAIMQRCAIHVCPSYCEGFGHYINEAMACGACVVTTDAPPMNELVDIETGVLVPYASKETVRILGTGYVVSQESLTNAINKAVCFTPQELQSIGNRAHNAYKKNKELFENKMSTVVNG